MKKFCFLLSLVLVLPVSAEEIFVPNFNFDEIYKPGSDTITGEILPGGWTQGVGPECPIDNNGVYNFSDATSGLVADIPGWIGYDRDTWIALGGTYNRDETTGNLQGSIGNQGQGVDGSYYYLANGGGWANPAGGLIVSDAPLGNVENGATYTLSMLAKGAANPVVLELLAGGTVVTPTSTVDPVLTGAYQEFSRTYEPDSLVDFIGEPLTICLGVGRNATGTQSHFENVSLDVTVLGCPGILSASAGAAGLMLKWHNGQEMPTSVRILRNTQEIAGAAPVDPPAYTDEDVQPGLIEYELIFTMPGEACESLTMTYDACITDLEAVRTVDFVELTWTNNLAYDGIEIKRDGEALASLNGTAETFRDMDAPHDLVSYTVVPTNGSCDPAAVEVDMNLVRNPGFEEPVLADGESTETDIPHWKPGFYEILVDPLLWIPGGNYGGVWNPDAIGGFSSSAAPEGQNTGWATSGAEIDAGLSQVLIATLEVDTVYTLSVEVGNAFYNGSDFTAPFRIELLAGGMPLTSIGGDSPAADTWEIHTLTYNSDDHPDLIGEQLEIRLIAELYADGTGADGYGVDFDDVLLTFSGDDVQDPEPPENVAATAEGTTITVTWDPPSGGPEPTNYVVLRGNAGEVPPGVTYTEIHEGPANELTLTDSGLDPRIAYCYVVRSKDTTTGATSVDSNEACATTGTDEAIFRRGDADTNGTVELTDVIRALSWQFVGGVEIPCLDAADIDDDGEITLTDAIRSLNYQFVGVAGTMPEPPGPLECGPDAGPDSLPDCVYPPESCQ